MQQEKKIICVTPIYNDWESFSILAEELEKVRVEFSNYQIKIVAINDGSSEETKYPTTTLPIQIVNLKPILDIKEPLLLVCNMFITKSRIMIMW